MDYLIKYTAIFVITIWTIRPLYNFFQKNKYVLLSKHKDTFKDKIRAGLPAIIFYLIVIGLIVIPATVNKLINTTTTGSVILLQIITIFFISRYDKRQTRYKVSGNDVSYKRSIISFNDPFILSYKKTWLVVLHKPRFIIENKNEKIVIPILSKNINEFTKQLIIHDKSHGEYAKKIVDNSRAYYVDNLSLAKSLNKN